MLCPKCGSQNTDTNYYCGNCGRKLKKKSSKTNWPIVIVILLLIAGAIHFYHFDSKETKSGKEPDTSAVQLETDEKSALTNTDDYIAYLDGDWEQVTLYSDSSTMNAHAFAFTQQVEKCKSMKITMDVDMKANTKCSDWQVWGRVDGNFQKLAKINLPEGNGSTTQTVRFSTPTTLDAIAITPTIPGNYSWSMGIMIEDVQTAG